MKGLSGKIGAAFSKREKDEAPSTMMELLHGDEKTLRMFPLTPAYPQRRR
jgi:hypothetical protein